MVSRVSMWKSRCSHLFMATEILNFWGHVWENITQLHSRSAVFYLRVSSFLDWLTTLEQGDLHWISSCHAGKFSLNTEVLHVSVLRAIRLAKGHWVSGSRNKPVCNQRELKFYRCVSTFHGGVLSSFRRLSTTSQLPCDREEGVSM